MPSKQSERSLVEIPKSFKRDVTDFAELACNVARIKCPVLAACKAIDAVSLSLISPIRITSGSCRRRARKATANVKPAFSLVCI